VGLTVIEDFVHHLARAERSPLTIKNYHCDLTAFATWFRDTNEGELTPAQITPTDLRDYKRFLVDQRGLKPSSVNRQLATLKSFLTWAAAAGLLPVGPPPVLPKAVLQERRGPRWLDRREQQALRRAVERGGQVRDIAVVTLLLNTGLRLQELCALTWRDVRVTTRKGLVRHIITHAQAASRKRQFRFSRVLVAHSSVQAARWATQ
jgi:site-specific recombinase XerD